SCSGTDPRPSLPLPPGDQIDGPGLRSGPIFPDVAWHFRERLAQESWSFLVSVDQMRALGGRVLHRAPDRLGESSSADQMRGERLACQVAPGCAASAWTPVDK